MDLLFGETFSNNIFLVDWDDTLLPTHWLGKNGYLIAEQDEDEFKYKGVVDYIPYTKEYVLFLKTIKKFIEAIQKRGCLIILTSSNLGWIAMTKHLLGSDVEKMLEGVEVVYTTDKIKSLPIIANAHSSFADNIISFGDGDYEKMAMKLLRSSNPVFWCKHFCFAKQPSVCVLIEEYTEMMKSLDEIIKVKKHLEIAIIITIVNKKLTEEEHIDRPKSEPI